MSRNKSLPLSRPGVKATALSLIAIGFTLRLYNLGSESLWYDELLQLDIAQGSLDWLMRRLPAHTAVPLDYVIMYGWVRLGRGEFWVRLPAVMWGVLTLPLVYQLGRRLAGIRTGLLLLALLALAPMHVYYSQEARPYALVVVGVTLAVYAFWCMRRTGRWFYIWPLQAGILIAVLAHIFSAAIFLPLFLFAAVDLTSARRRRQAARMVVSLILVGLLPLVILLALGWGNVLFYSSTEFGKALMEPEKLGAEAGQKPNRGEGPQLSWSFVKEELLEPLGAGQEKTAALWLLNGLAGLGWLSLVIRRRYALAWFLLLWLLLPIVTILAFLVYRGTFFNARYIISILPAYLLLISLGVLALPHWLKNGGAGRFLRLGSLTVLAGLVLLTFGQDLHRLYTEQDKENWRLATGFITENAAPGDAIMAVRAEPAVNWYYPPAWTLPGAYDDLAAVQTTAAAARRSWVILSIFSAGHDDRIRAWLSEQQAVRLVLDPVIHVYYLGPNVSREELLREIQNFALPVDHALYASLARENRRRPAVARRYYELAIANAPDEATRAEYRSALEGLDVAR